MKKSTRPELTESQRQDALRLSNVMKSHKLTNPDTTQESLAFACGWKTQGAVSQYINGRIPLNLDALLKFSKFFGVEPREISPVLAEKLADQQRLATEIQAKESPSNYTVSKITGKIPLITNVQAGMWSESNSNFHPGVAEEWIPTTGKITPRMFAVKVIGDSMTNPYGFPSLPPGVIVIVDTERSPANGDIVIARLDDSAEATIKKLVIDGNQRFLKPLNPQYPVIQINGNCTIIGVADRVEFKL